MACGSAKLLWPNLARTTPGRSTTFVFLCEGRREMKWKQDAAVNDDQPLIDVMGDEVDARWFAVVVG